MLRLDVGWRGGLVLKLPRVGIQTRWNVDCQNICTKLVEAVNPSLNVLRCT